MILNVLAVGMPTLQVLLMFAFLPGSFFPLGRRGIDRRKSSNLKGNIDKTSSSSSLLIKIINRLGCLLDAFFSNLHRQKFCKVQHLGEQTCTSMGWCQPCWSTWRSRPCSPGTPSLCLTLAKFCAAIRKEAYNVSPNHRRNLVKHDGISETALNSNIVGHPISETALNSSTAGRPTALFSILMSLLGKQFLEIQSFSVAQGVAWQLF